MTTIIINNKNSNNNNNNDLKYLVCYFIISVAVKVLLFPSYRSTDFDVHRHWKALTRSLNVSEWYFDNEHVVDTIHTLDYPPSFAFFEYFWSTNVITNWLIQNKYLDNDCLSLESSSPLLSSSIFHGYQNPSTACTAFMRSSVILSDIVLWLGAWMIASAVVTAATVTTTTTTTTTTSNDNNNDDKAQKQTLDKQKMKWTIFGLLVTNPGLLWLDSIHFQYNGFLLGILLLSLVCLVRGNHHQHHHTDASIRTTATAAAGAIRTTTDNTWLFHFWHIMTAILFAGLLTLKHLYMTLSLWYFAYLLRRYCFVHVQQQQQTTTTKTTPTNKTNDNVVHVVVFKPMRLLLLGVVTVTTLVVPFLPFFLSSSSHHHRTAMQQATRIFERLFPFGRGLVHDYWAGNVWAMYMAMTKVFPSLNALEPSPKAVIGLLVVALVPGAVVAWKAAAMACQADFFETVSPSSSSTLSNVQYVKVQRQTDTTRILLANELLWSSFTYTTLAAFMIAYHVHEKAILTTLLPMTIWLCMSCYNHRDDVNNASKNDGNNQEAGAAAVTGSFLLLWRTMVFGLLGLFPLLFHPTELLVKLFSFTAYIVVLYEIISVTSLPSSSSPFQSSPPPTPSKRPRKWYTFLTSRFQLVLVWFFIAFVLLVLEYIPLRYFGRYEFVPLALTSLTTAMGLLISFLEVSWKMMQLYVAKY